jgi:hypothetical protein
LLPPGVQKKEVEKKEVEDGFFPSMKLVEKYRKGSRIIKIYDSPKTPLQRVLESPYGALLPKTKIQKAI